MRDTKAPRLIPAGYAPNDEPNNVGYHFQVGFHKQTPMKKSLTAARTFLQNVSTVDAIQIGDIKLDRSGKISTFPSGMDETFKNTSQVVEIMIQVGWSSDSMSVYLEMARGVLPANRELLLAFYDVFRPAPKSRNVPQDQQWILVHVFSVAVKRTDGKIIRNRKNIAASFKVHADGHINLFEN